MREIVLPGRSKKLGSIDFGHILHRHAIEISNSGEIPKMREVGLHMVQNANAECFVYRVWDSLVESKRVAGGENSETFDACLTIPGTKAEGMQVVDAIGQAEPLCKRGQTDAARCDKDRRIAVDPLKYAAKPAQKLVDALRTVIVAIVAEHSHEKYGQLVNDEEYPPVVFCATAD